MLSEPSARQQMRGGVMTGLADDQGVVMLTLLVQEAGTPNSK